MSLAGSADSLDSRLVAFRDLAAARGVPVGRVGDSVVVQPGSTDEVAAVVRWAVGCDLGVVAGTASESSAEAVGIDLRRLARIVDYRPQDMLAVVETGVTLGDLESVASADSLTLPTARTERDDLLIGELLAGGSARGLTGGPTRDYVLGLRFVSASGEVVSTGSRAIKNATGYSLTQLLLGAHHHFGIVVEATIRLAPLQSASRTVVAEYPSFAAARVAALAATPPGGPASSLEAFDPVAAAALAELGVSPGRAALLGLVEATDADLAESRLADLSRRLASTSPEASRTVDEAVNLRLRVGRRDLGERLRQADSPQASFSAPRERIDSLSAELNAIVRSRGGEASAFGEVGAGSQTFVVRSVGASDAAGCAARRSLAVEIARAVHTNGGAILDLRGFGLDSWEVADLALTADGAATLRAAKRALDPSNVFRCAKR